MRAKAEDLDDGQLAAVLDEIRTSAFPGSCPQCTHYDADGPLTWDQIQHYLAEAARRLDPRTRTT